MDGWMSATWVTLQNGGGVKNLLKIIIKINKLLLLLF
jgi:hypothetical protein